VPNVFNVDAYLSSLDYSGTVDRVPQTVRELQKQHLMSIPFDNSRRLGQGTSSLQDVDIDLDAAFDEVILKRRGGVCFELNGLFNRLLTELGFDTMFLGAGVRGPGGTFGPDLEHMFLGVRLPDQLWLADVGFAGPGYLEPLHVTTGVQRQYGCDYRILERDGYHIVERKTRNGDWQGVYRFKPQPRRLIEWVDDTGNADETDAWNWEGELVAADTVIRARSFDAGQRVLIGKRLLTVDDGEERIRVLVNPADYETTVEQLVGSAG
jgi:amide synthase